MAAKRKNLKKKIASLSALGAGVVVFGAGEAHAEVIYSGAINVHVGFGAGGAADYKSPSLGPGGAYFSFFRTSTATAFFHGRAVVGYGCGCFQFATQVVSSGPPRMRIFDHPGAKWTSSMTGYWSALVGARLWVYAPASGSGPASSGAIAFGNPSFSEKFALFRFLAGPGPDSYNYGWMQLSFTIDPQVGDNPEFGPDLYIHRWAYDDSGQLLAAGTVPEPGNLIPTGLAALALGATGLRRWRKARKAA